MHRTQLSLEQWQYDVLKAQSARTGRSISDLVRQILEKHLHHSGASGPGKLRALKGIGSDPAALAQDHDKVIYGVDWR